MTGHQPVSAVLACALLLGSVELDVACTSNTVAPMADTVVKSGSWGGQGITLSVTASGGSVEYDCGHGVINRALAVDRDGHIDVTGLHYREGGPARRDEEGEPARYQGTVNGDTMSLTVTLPQTSTNLGSFTLRFGQTPQLRKCV